jgi:hypothetical protein
MVHVSFRSDYKITAKPRFREVWDTHLHYIRFNAPLGRSVDTQEAENRCQEMGRKPAEKLETLIMFT